MECRELSTVGEVSIYSMLSRMSCCVLKIVGIWDVQAYVCSCKESPMLCGVFKVLGYLVLHYCIFE